MTVCRVCQNEKTIERGEVCVTCRSRQSRAKHHAGATREELRTLKNQAKKEKEQSDVRIKALRALAIISQLKPYMLPEEVTAVRAIIEPYTLPIYRVAAITDNALSGMLAAGTLVDAEEEEQEQENGSVQLDVRTPAEMRRDAEAALLLQGFPANDISKAANLLAWDNDESMDAKLRALLAALRPTLVKSVEPDSMTLPPTLPQRVRQVSA